MATVTNNMTRIHDAEGALTTANLPAGGAAASANTDIFLQAAQSLGKRITVTATTEGFVLVDAADNDVSAASVHVGVWFWVTHFSILDDVRVVFGTGTGSPTNYDAHTFPISTEYPKLGGWVRSWVDISRTPENSGGTGLNEAQLRSYGVQISFSSAPGGNAANLILDAADYIAGAALTLTGTSGVWTDFTTADENTTNQFGVFRLIGGIYNCFARVQLGSSSSLAFTDSNFAIIFPRQALVESIFMGINIDLQHASTAIIWTNGTLKSAAPSVNRGDFVVTSTTGSFDASNCIFDGMRVVTLTSACSLLSCLFLNTGQITAAGAELDGSSVSGYEGTADTSALVWDVNTDPDGYLDNTTFTKGTAATHGVEFGTTSPTSITLRGVTFSGYNASNNQNDSAIHIKRTSGTVTLNIIGGTSPSYRSDGATVVIIADPVTIAVNVKDNNSSNLQNARVLLKAAAGGSFPFNASVTISRSGGTATVAHTAHGMDTNDKVMIVGANEYDYNGVYSITKIDDNSYSYTVANSPATPATGTITSTFVPLYGLTDASGNISASRVYSADQPVSGWVRKQSGASYFKTSILGGIVDNATGYSANVQMILDQ